MHIKEGQVKEDKTVSEDRATETEVRLTQLDMYDALFGKEGESGADDADNLMTPRS